MKYLFSAFLLALSFAPLAAQADMIPDNTHIVATSLAIENATAYPDYQFYAVSSDGDAEIKFDGNNFFKFWEKTDRSRLELIAVLKTNVAKIKTIPWTCDGAGCGNPNPWWTISENKNLIIHSYNVIYVDNIIPDLYPITSMKLTYHIDSLDASAKTTEQGIKMHLASSVMYDKAGALITSEASKPAISTDQIMAGVPALPAPFDNGNDGRVILSSPAVAMSPFALIWIVIVCMGAIVLALTIKTWKK